MKKTKLFLSTLMIWCCVLGMKATTVKPYTMNFNVDINTTEHDFVVGSSWGHIVDFFIDGYAKYTYHTTGGVDNTGYMEVSSQVMVDWDTQEEHLINDLLVSPVVKGKMSIMAKTTRKGSSSAGIRFFKVTEEGGKLVMGDEITPTVYQLEYDHFTKVELPTMPAGTRIGIRGSNVAIDNFEAEEADVNQVQALSIAQAVWNGGKYADCNAEGKYKVTYKVQVVNSGDLTLQPGTKGYTLNLKELYTDNVLATINIQQTLKPAETSEPIIMEAELSSKQYPTAELYIKEELSGNIVYLPIVTPSSFAPDFRLTGAYGTTPMVTGNSIEFGASRKEVTVNLMLRNMGAQPQHITTLSTTPGFKASLNAPIDIAGHDSIAFSVSMTTNVKGNKQGLLTVKGDYGVDIVIDLKGYTPTDQQLFYDFENEQLPEGFINNNAWFIDDMPNYVYSINNHYCLRNTKQVPVKLILPKMKVQEGEALYFWLSKVYENSSYVNIYYSADRKNWQLLREIKASEMSNQSFAPSWEGYYYGFTPFSINNIPAGQWYIAFEAGCVYLDNIITNFSLVPTTHNAYFDRLRADSEGQVNSPINVSATLHNVMNHEVTADSYKVAFYLDDECMGYVPSTVLAAMGERNISLSITPHKEGTLNGYWKFITSEGEITSDIIKIDVEEETTRIRTLTDMLVSHSYSNSAPFDPYNFNGESEAIYTAEELGLKPGTTIKSISWYGANLGEDILVNAKVYLQNTSASTIAPNANGEYTMTDRSAMTEVHNGKIMLFKDGTEEMYARIMNVTLVKPFVYTGGNLRVAFLGSTDTGSRTFFAATKGVMMQNRSITRANVDASQLATTTIFHDALPVIGIGYDTKQRTVSGQVTHQHTAAPIANATVTLQSGQVRYTATTNANGQYSIEVFKSNLDYEASITAEGCTAATRTVHFDNADVTLNIALADTASGISNINHANADGVKGIYTVDGKKLQQLQQGINIVQMCNGTVKKVIVK